MGYRVFGALALAGLAISIGGAAGQKAGAPAAPSFYKNVLPILQDH
jgi:hypothetical protein